MKRWDLKFDEVKEEGGGNGAPPKSETKPDATTSKDAPASKAEGDQFDDLGYKVESASEGNKDEKGKADNKSKQKEPDKVEKLATGYDEKPPEAPPEPPKEEPKVDLGFELNTEGLDEKEATRLKDFVKKNTFTKEQAQAYADLKRSELDGFKVARADFEKNVEKEKTRIKGEWDKELRNHPTFGGEKFAFNRMRVEKFLDEVMPETKKILTENKSMLPPYVMRDLAHAADLLWGVEKLKQGEPIVPKIEEKDDNDPLAYYQ